MKGIRFLVRAPSAHIFLFILAFTLPLLNVVHAQEASPTPPEAEMLPRRIAKARALAAVGKLGSAASELESLRASNADESAREVTRILLMWIYVEMPDYTRAGAMLEEAFNARTSSPNETAVRSFYALAGQTVNGVRAHLDRYRTFGLDISDSDLPADAHGDLEQLRALLERITGYAKTIREEETKTAGGGSKGLEATALLEDAASIRLRIARHSEDRQRWQSELSDARRRIFASETRIASISSIPITRPDIPATTTASTTPARDGRSGSQTSANTRSPKSEPVKTSDAPARTTTANTTTKQAAPAAPPVASPTAAASNNEAAPKREGTEATPVAVGALAAKARQKVSPTYPSIAKTARIAGVVTVYLVVNEKGEVETVERVTGPTQLQQAASEAARRWKFSPTLVDGQPVRVAGFLSFNFSL